HATVGILLRRRVWIPELIRALREAGIAASDKGGNPLTDSAAVLQALSLLHLADHPGDLAAALHVATSTLGRKGGVGPEQLRARGERGLLTMRPDPEGEIAVVTHGVKKEIARLHAELERVRADVARRRMVEELCVLYVAMTRARHRLDLIVQGREKEGGGLSY